MRDGFYRAFEERFRGSRDSIISRLRVYLPFLAPLVQFEQGARVLDLGCGRGEWLELMTEIGLTADGVDLDAQMLEACRRRGLSVYQEDAIAHLGALSDQSRAVVSAFHLVEHLSFDRVGTLVEEALRVLTPGGLLILETPNPENIIVATWEFYLDPTHQRPLPPALLAFLPEYCGFARTKVLRLQESKALVKNASPALNDVLGGASPDYAVVAQKAAHAVRLALFDKAFDPDYGLLAHTIADRYDAAIDAGARHAEDAARQAHDTARAAQARAEQAHNTARAAESRALQAQDAARAAESRAEQVHDEARMAQDAARTAQARAEQVHDEVRAAESRALQAQDAARAAESRAGQAEAALAAIYKSRSWRITAPLRFASLKVSSGNRYIKTALRTGLGEVYSLLNRSPVLKQQLLQMVAAFPTVEMRLRRAVYGQIFGDGFRAPDNPQDLQCASATGGRHDDPDGDPEGLLDRLNPRERKIFRELKNAMQKNARGA